MAKEPSEPTDEEENEGEDFLSSLDDEIAHETDPERKRYLTELKDRLTRVEDVPPTIVKTAPPQPTVKPDLIIGRIPYPRWWQDSLNAKIDFVAPNTQSLATVSGSLRLYVSTIVVTVTAETVITITFGDAGSSGPIYLGGTDQPRGFVIAMGNSPSPCGHGPLKITATDPASLNPSVGGFATCFAVPEKE